MKRRAPAVAGSFYPADAAALRGQVGGFLRAAASETDESAPKAIVAPHAGLVYSGPVAATAYARVAALRDVVRRVVLLGPAHRLGFRGIATSSADAFATPLGDVPVDRDSVMRLLELPFVRELDEAHRLEHSLEVHLPFLQEALSRFALVPLLVGVAEPEQVEAVLDAVWGGDDTLVVVSSDLSHFHDHSTARERDQRTSRNIEALAWERLEHDDACGFFPLRGLLRLARRRGLTARAVDVRNSGDTAGDRSRVVGYGSYLFV